MRSLIAMLVAVVLAAPAMAAPGTAGPVKVLELFQSQGCSSCPPANANLNAVAGRPDVIALSYGVTYWDYLGWRDRFATPAFTARQRAYQTTLGNANVFTPQMVVNGRRDLVGAAPREVTAALAAAAPLSGQAIMVSAGTVRANSKAPAELWLVAYDPAERLVAVGAGENQGRKLPHRNVVVELRRLGPADGKALALPAATAGLDRVVLLQTAGVGAILDAVRL